MKKILPIGSIVRLKHGEQKLMIMCRAALYNNQGTLGYFEYSACLYPAGQTEQNAFFFNEEDIEEVIFEGYRDEAEEQFCAVFEEQIAKTQFPRLHLEHE